MKKNMGTIDRIVRTIIVLTIAALYYLEIISGTVAMVLGVVATVFLITSIVSFCPLYKLLGLSSCPVKE